MKAALKLVVVLVSAVLLLGAGAYLASGPLKEMTSTIFSQQEPEIHNTQIVDSVKREEQVVLLSLAIQGINEHRTENKKFYSFLEIPNSSRSQFVKFDFTAKLGIEGSEVRIAETAENEFLVTVPEFIFIGHDDVKFARAAEQNGAFSWMNTKADEFEIATEILDGEARTEYVSQYEDVLKDQTVSFYRQIASSVDPAAVLEFEFS